MYWGQSWISFMVVFFFLDIKLSRLWTHKFKVSSLKPKEGCLENPTVIFSPELLCLRKNTSQFFYCHDFQTLSSLNTSHSVIYIFRCGSRSGCWDFMGNQPGPSRAWLWCLYTQWHVTYVRWDFIQKLGIIWISGFVLLKRTIKGSKEGKPGLRNGRILVISFFMESSQMSLVTYYISLLLLL